VQSCEPQLIFSFIFPALLPTRLLEAHGRPDGLVLEKSERPAGQSFRRRRMRISSPFPRGGSRPRSSSPKVNLACGQRWHTNILRMTLWITTRHASSPSQTLHVLLLVTVASLATSLRNTAAYDKQSWRTARHRSVESTTPSDSYYSSLILLKYV
jgi:hypothetical protein